jgi:Transposase DDE domain
MVLSSHDNANPSKEASMAHPTAVPQRLTDARCHLNAQEGLPFSHLLSADRIRSVLDQLGVVFRDRLFSPLLTLWTFLSQALSADGSCRDAVARLLAWRAAQGRTPCSADPSSYCQARQRLPLDLVRTLTRQTGQLAPERAQPQWLWHGRHVKIVDGTTLTMPDTPANQNAFPRRANQTAGVGFPIARLVVLFSLAWATALDLALGPTKGKKTGETTLFRTLFDALQPGDIVLGDRLFDAYGDIVELSRRGVDVVLRMRGGRGCDFRRGRWLATLDHLVVWNKPRFHAGRLGRAVWAAQPQQLTVRELRYRVSTPGFRTQEVVLVSTLVDAAVYAKAEVADLYHQRWQCELDLNALKTTLQMEHLRCQTPEMVEKEVWVHLLAYNLLRQTMAEAARAHGVLPRQLSFKGAQQAVNAFAPYLAVLAEAGERLWQELLRAVARHRVGERPDRVEPRKLKRRVGKYSYMTKPRKQEREQCYA